MIDGFLPAADLAACLPHPVEPPPAGTDGLALVQFNSGCTAAPKGVRLTRRNVLRGITAIRTATARSATGW